MMFSPTEVVSPAGPAGSLAERPNLGHCLRWATRGLTTSRCVMRRMRRVVLTVWPLSLKRYEMTVLVPSRFWMVSSGGRAVVAMGSLSSSSSAQSLVHMSLLEGGGGGGSSELGVVRRRGIDCGDMMDGGQAPTRA